MCVVLSLFDGCDGFVDFGGCIFFGGVVDCVVFGFGVWVEYFILDCV